MSEVLIELCPETGICSILKSGACKVDLMPHEVAALREAKGDVAVVKDVVAECDSTFAAALGEEELSAIAGRFS